MDAQRGLSVSGHRNTVLCLHLTSDTYHVTPSGRAPRARGKFWIRRVKLRIFRPDPKSHKSEGFPAAQIFKTHKCQNTYCRSAHFSKAVKFVGAQNPRGTPCGLLTSTRIHRRSASSAASAFPQATRATSATTLLRCCCPRSLVSHARRSIWTCAVVVASVCLTRRLVSMQLCLVLSTSSHTAGTPGLPALLALRPECGLSLRPGWAGSR